MDQMIERPALRTEGEPSWTESRAARHPENKATRRGIQRLVFRLVDNGDLITVCGRQALTLDLLIKVGDQGFNSGQASPLGWARRTSHYIHQLRAVGVPITTTWETIGDARVGRYTLTGPVFVVEPLGVAPCE